MEKNRPCYEKRIGSVRLAIWRNTNNSQASQNARVWHNVAITRRYKDGDEWKEAPTLNGLGDLAQAALAVRLAQEWISRQEDASTGDDNGE